MMPKDICNTHASKPLGLYRFAAQSLPHSVFLNVMTGTDRLHSYSSSSVQVFADTDRVKDGVAALFVDLEYRVERQRLQTYLRKDRKTPLDLISEG